MGSNEQYAHTPNLSRKWQPLREHLHNVARLAESFASAFEAQDLGYAAGACHDLGKASPEFQRYLIRCWEAKLSGKTAPPPAVDHKVVGAALACRLSQVLALPILGHHGGLPSLSAAKSKLADVSNSDTLDNYAKLADEVFKGRATSKLELPRWTSEKKSLDFFVRMLFSALVDADYLDTEMHFEPDRTVQRFNSSTVPELWQRFQRDQEDLLSQAADTLVNKCRHEIYLSCIAAAEAPQGVFLLTVPTGGGKTRSAMGFALRHALVHSLRRVIVAIPYTSIIDQNAQVYRSILGNHNVLEHHSAVDLNESEEYSEQVQRQLLAAENWDVPIVVTTTVQLFESLFSNKTSKCRKLHNLARSVIILDEVQTLPTQLLQPILDVLRDLVDHYGVSLVLSTATQPALAQNSCYIRGFDKTVQIVEDFPRYFQLLKRVQYRVERGHWPWERVAEEISRREQVLCVVNSRKDALDLCRLLDGEDVFHLSTLMCPIHRRAVIEEIRRRLESGKPCRVVSTQVVEAGVDLDFQCVMRAFGPLDRVVQAAGRCNREGLRGTDGEVILFSPDTQRMPKGPYATASKEAEYVLNDPNTNLHDPNVFEKYFSRLWQNLNLDAYRITVLREAFDYPAVAERFKMIEEDTVPVVVGYGRPDVDEIVVRVERTGVIERHEWRALQQYCVGVYRRDFDRYAKAGLVRKVAEGLYLWEGVYSNLYGLSEDLKDPADLIA
ncbi:MAG: CRISPR-associated helicase Cas3' [Armatimonadota bacterium]|nr:CRISPR-associated helicase Cas3' [Armatimonadota bacterium]